MKIGYARVSSENQNLARQIEALKKSGVEVDCKFNPNFWTNLSA